MKTNVVRVNFDDMFLDDVVMNIQPYEMESLGEYLKKKRGWLYIAKNPHVPHLKIGRTTKDPWTRAKTLSAAGILEDFEIIYSMAFMNQVVAEKRVHQLLNSKRINPKKEFFSTNVDFASTAIIKALNEERSKMDNYFKGDIYTFDLDVLSLQNIIVEKNKHYIYLP
jgi:hypothetical protein